MAVFKENLTSKLIVRAVLEKIPGHTCRVLEIGCGSGWITSELVHFFGSESTYALSDISSDAIELSKQRLASVPIVDCRVGPGLEPWLGTKFDVVINDIAGICDQIAEISEWYIDVEFRAGKDGIKNGLEVLQRIAEVLDSDQSFYVVPLISLSDVDKHLAELNQKFNSVVLTEKTWWPLPEGLRKNMSIIQNLQAQGLIEVVEKYGKLLASTQVCIATGINQ
jgi:SAM-dependent methyltransferase